MKYFYVFFAIQFFFQFVVCQGVDFNKNDARRYKGIGECSELKGDILVYPVISQSNKEFFPVPSEAEILDSLRIACDFLIHKSEEYSVPLNLVLPESVEFLISKHESNKTSKVNPGDFFSSNYLAKMDSLKKIYKVSKVVVFEIYFGFGKRQAILASRDNPDSPEFVFFPWLSSDGMLKPYPQIMAHEILHLFGATDLYYSEGKLSPNAKMAQQLFYFDIMIWPVRAWRKIELGVVTRYLIGWEQNLPDEYLVLMNTKG